MATSANYVHVKPYGTSSGSLKVYIPSIMSKIPMGAPKITPVSINKSAFINANDCKPALANMLNTQNYATAKAPYNQYKLPCYYFGDVIDVNALQADFLTCQLSPETTDNSKNWP